MATRRTLWEMAKRWKGTAALPDPAQVYAAQRKEWKKKLSETRKSYAEHVIQVQRQEKQKKRQMEEQLKEKNRVEKLEREKNKRTGPRVPEIYHLALRKIERKPKIKEVKRLQWKAVLDTVRKRQNEKEEKLLEESKRWIGDVETLEQRVQDALANPARMGD